MYAVEYVYSVFLCYSPVLITILYIKIIKQTIKQHKKAYKRPCTHNLSVCLFVSVLTQRNGNIPHRVASLQNIVVWQPKTKKKTLVKCSAMYD